MTNAPEQKPLSRVEIAKYISTLVVAVLDKQIDSLTLVRKLRKIADLIEQKITPGGSPAKPKKEKKPRPAPVASETVHELFDFWRQTMGHDKALLTSGRAKALTDRLKDGYSPALIRDAIVGCSRNPHNMGANDRKERYDDLTLICRSGENVERFARGANNAPIVGGPSALAADYDPRKHGDMGHLGGEYARKWNLFVDVGASRYESEWAKRSGA